uniref:Uncharacterized protein n=1 Tax=Caenorhabditis japonica TaxID=281687 RepID=A0A8R1IK34_CAEJA
MCAIVTALADTKLPSIVLNHATEDESAIEKSQILADNRIMHGLKLEEPLMCCSFGVFADSDDVTSSSSSEVLLFAPSWEVIAVCRATCSVIVGAEDKVVMVRERGRMTNFKKLQQMCKITADRRQKFVNSLKSSA